MDVGVRELKQHLSEYVQRAEQGEMIRVTDRGRPKALLGPIPGTGRLQQGIQEGWITPGSGERLSPVVRSRSSRKVIEVLAEDRHE